MKRLLWQIASVCLLLLLCWHPTKYAECTKQPPEAQSLHVPAHDSSSEEEPVETSHYKGAVQIDQCLGDVQPLSEDKVETQQKVLVLAEEELQNPVTEVEGIERVQTNDLEDSATQSDLQRINGPEAGPDTTAPEAGPDTTAPEAGPVDDQPPLDVTKEEQPTPPFEQSPQPSAPALDSISVDPSRILGSVSGVVEETHVPVADPSDSDLALNDCEDSETNPFDSTLPSLPIVLENASNVLGKGTKTDMDSPLSQAGQSSVGLAPGVNTSHMLKEQDLSSHSAPETDPSVAAKDAEDIPTFDEWKKKMMEVEKERTQASHTSTVSGSNTVKKMFNNYASLDCGAKILGSNPEAKSAAAILMESKDHYMLNPCSNKIWFIIELCDPIQVKQLDIANFELFSSTPKDFLVSISNRYPPIKWVKLGIFHARDERTIQTFPLDKQLYAKYVKVELISHYGSEHFCPLSLIRVFGTSMVEEYEEIADPHDRPDDLDDDLDYPRGHVPTEYKASKNLIGSAREAILNMVNNIKVNVLGEPPGEGNFSGQAMNVTTMTPSSPDATSTLSPVPDDVELPQVPEDPEVTTTDDPKSEHPTTDTSSREGPKQGPSAPDTPASDETKLKNLAEEDIIYPKEEEEVQSIVTVLEAEEEEEERREREEHPGLQQESLDYCDLSSSPCSCAASLQDYLLHHCSVHRKCTSQEREMEAPPATTPSQQPIPPTATQTPHQPQDPREESQEREPSSALSERGTRHADHPPHLPWVETEPVEDPSSEQPLLEPSQTPCMPTHSSTVTPNTSTRPTPTVDLPHPTSSQGLPGQLPSVAEKGLEERNEENRWPAISSAATSDPVEPSWGASTDERPCLEVQTADNPQAVNTAPVSAPLPAVSVPPEQLQPPTPPPEPESAADSSTPEESRSVPVAVPTGPRSPGQAASAEPGAETELVEDVLFTSSLNVAEQQLTLPASAQPSPSPSDFYAELHNPAEQGNPMHGSASQKESVFMRLNNRIKALEMNMSLSGRYLEQLSQRYRRQMEEMQRAFNKTVLKLQHTSRMAEEQDLRQTESIQSLQGQLEDVTVLVLNLSVRVAQLQSQVSDRQSYLLLSLLLCVFLGALLFVQRCRRSAMEPPTTRPPLPRSYSYCCPQRHSLEYKDMSLKRPASYPLLHSESLQLPATTEGPELPHMAEPLKCPPANKKKKRGPIKALETVRGAALSAPPLANGAPVCNGRAPRGPTDPTAPKRYLSLPAFRDPSSEGSSDGSSQLEEPSFCGLAAASCTRLCDAPPLPCKAGKRSFRRRSSKPGLVVVDLLQAPQRDRSAVTPPIPTLQHLVGGKELSAGTLGVTAL
ncbi:SUN domain-containing ossification factor isoform X2 [Esox lucius]|uniref:SUN domain-containing ossification factor isoform X2 n=1 Tax=Esox lucius TaxID=8010 RepID=UPI001476CD4D|nr:SUN domain-containing ossification factor isoform X2 [Esox lucius]